MCVAIIRCQSSSVRSVVPSSSTSPPVVSRVRPIPALLTSTSIVPKVARNSPNIFFTAALLDTSATKGRATPPALDFRRKVLRRLGANVVDANLRAFAREEQTHLAPESRTAARDQHNLVLQPHPL